MRIIRSAKLFFRGPVWMVAWPVSFLFGIFGIVQEAKGLDLGSLWMWLFLGSLGLVAAAFLTFHRGRMADEAKRESLPFKIDELQREGKALLDELLVPYKPTQRGATTEVFAASTESFERVWAFQKRIQDLFLAEYPALVSDYGNRFTEHRQKQRELKSKGPDSGQPRPINLQTMLALAREERDEPVQELEATLEGLSAARHRVGLSAPAKSRVVD
jgi:hypothetical protein